MSDEDDVFTRRIERAAIVLSARGGEEICCKCKMKRREKTKLTVMRCTQKPKSVCREGSG